jgi:hypothetical protein
MVTGDNTSVPLTSTILSLDIVGKCFAEHSSDDIVDGSIEVEALVLAFGWTAKARLQGEAVYQIELTPHDDSRC